MRIRGESDFARKPVLENCSFFTCAQCGYCGYHSWRFGEGVTGRGRPARNRVQGNTRLDRRRKPEGLRAEASGFAEHWRSEVDYGFIYRDCEVVMNARNIVTFWITISSFWGEGNGLSQRNPSCAISMNMFRKPGNCSRAQGFGGLVSMRSIYKRTVASNVWKKSRDYELVLIFSWLGALLIWGFLLWAAFRLLCRMVQLVRYVPGCLR